MDNYGQDIYMCTFRQIGGIGFQMLVYFMTINCYNDNF